MGFEVDPKAVKVNWEKVIGRSRGVTTQLNSGIGFLFKKNKIEHVQGHAKILNGKSGSGPCKVQVSAADENYYAGTGKAGKGEPGGDPLATALKHPHGVAVDIRGTLYISDSENGRILKLVP